MVKCICQGKTIGKGKYYRGIANYQPGFNVRLSITCSQQATSSFSRDAAKEKVAKKLLNKLSWVFFMYIFKIKLHQVLILYSNLSCNDIYLQEVKFACSRLLATYWLQIMSPSLFGEL